MGEFSYGNMSKGILFIRSHPTLAELEEKQLGSSSEMKVLRGLCSSAGLNFAEDCRVITALPTKPSGRHPNKQELDYCRGRLQHTIEKLEPRILIPMGRNALYALIGHKFSVPPRVPKSDENFDSDYESWVGHKIPDREYKKIIVPFYNIHDIQKGFSANMGANPRSRLPLMAQELMQEIAEFQYEYKNLTFPVRKDITYSPDEAIYQMDRILKSDAVAFDYETTGIKPYRKGHKITTVAFANDDVNISFPVFYSNEKFMNKLREVMESDVKMIIHNAKFELIWTREILGCDINNVYWDTMLVAHILDNRRKTVSLKFQSYVHFGVGNYNDVASRFIKYTKEDKDEYGDNLFNALKYLVEGSWNHSELYKKAWDVILSYDTQDAFFTYKLYKYQLEKVREFPYLINGIKLFMRAIVVFSDMQTEGITFDEKNANESFEILTKDIKEAEDKLLASDEYKLYLDEVGKPLNVNSSPQLKKFFYDILGATPEKFTKTGNPSTDKEALGAMSFESATYVLKIKELTKLRDTFIKSYLRESNDGVIHSFFNLDTARSYRSSSSSVNLQQISKRSDNAFYVRKTLTAKKGHFLLEADFKSIEVGVSACYNKDPNLITYVTDDEHNDMHRDTACDIFIYTPDTLPSRKIDGANLRQIAKNKFVFPEFYGDWYKSCALALWKSIDKEVKLHLSSHGINNYDDFEEHVKSVEDKFWYERFKVFTKWKKAQWNRYMQDGVVKLHTGFHCGNYMNWKQTGNYPIQGSAFHCMLFTLTTINDYIKQMGLGARIIGQIHDSMILTVPEEEKSVLPVLIQKALRKLKSEWKWLIVPLSIEFDMSPVNGSLADLKTAGKITEDTIVYEE